MSVCCNSYSKNLLISLPYLHKGTGFFRTFASLIIKEPTMDEKAPSYARLNTLVKIEMDSEELKEIMVLLEQG